MFKTVSAYLDPNPYKKNRPDQQHCLSSRHGYSLKGGTTNYALERHFLVMLTFLVHVKGDKFRVFIEKMYTSFVIQFFVLLKLIAAAFRTLCTDIAKDIHKDPC